MSVFSEANEDAYSVTPQDAASGPAIGFFDSFNMAVELQKRTSSQFGLEYYMHEVDWTQTKALLDAGVVNPPQLSNELGSGFRDEFNAGASRGYLNAARMYAGDEYAGMVDAETRARVASYDEKIKQIQKTRPDLHLYTSEQMFAKVKQKAQQIESDAANARRTWGGVFGDLAGGMLASLDPSTDPLNFFTLGVGGAGKTVLTRIAAQGAGQGAIEAVNQVTGVQTARDMLGLSSGVGDALSRVGMAAGGGALLQGVGEGVGRLAGRWFRATPDDPAPAPDAVLPPSKEPLALPHPDQFKEAAGAARIEANPSVHVDYLADKAPLSGIRAGKSRTLTDLNEITRQMDTWDAGPVVSMTPGKSVVRPDAPRVDVSDALANNTKYQAAKAADPKAFAALETLTKKRDTYRAWLNEMSGERNADVDATLSRMDARLAELENRHRTTQGKTNKLRIREQIAEVKADREKLLKAANAGDTPDMAQVRRSLAETDARMLELAPMLGRAYAQTQGKWAADADELDAIWNAYKAGKDVPEVLPVQNVLPDYDTVMQLQDRAPVLQRVKPEDVKPDATATDTAAAIVKREMEVMDEALESTRAVLKSAIGKEADGKLRVGEHEFDLKDTIWVPNDKEDGGTQITIKELLERNRQSEDELGAISTCSIQRRS